MVFPYVALYGQLEALHPELSEQDLEVLVSKRSQEVTLSTPRPAILQRFTWPAHCGYCVVFFRRIYSDDLNKIAQDGDGRSFFAAHIHWGCAQDYPGDTIQEWEAGLNGFGRFYLWQCRECQEYLLTCDYE